MCAVSILPSTRCSESTASSAILAPVIASAAISAVSTLTVNASYSGSRRLVVSVFVLGIELSNINLITFFNFF